MSFASMHNDYLDPDRFGLFNDEEADNDLVKRAFADFDGPYDLYRSVYKNTDCGPNLGFKIRSFEAVQIEEEGAVGVVSEACARVDTIWGSDLHRLGNWADMDSKGELVLAILVTSIVEGSDAETETIEIDCSIDALESGLRDENDLLWSVLARRVFQAVETVNDQAAAIAAGE
jgi:hypothetical protein